VLGKRVALGLGVLWGAVALVVGPGSAAHAQEVCTTPVYEETPRLGQYRQPIERLAETLRAAMGAEVYVRVLGRVPNGDLDGWQASMQARCPNWQDEVGLRRPKLIVLAVAVEDRKTGLYYGVDYAGALDQQWQRIQVEFMNPAFQRGDYGAGITVGLSEVASAIAQHQAPPTTPPTDAPPGVVRQPGPGGDGFGDWRRIDPGYEVYEEPGGGPGGGDGFPGVGAFMVVALIVMLLVVAFKVLSAGGSGTGMGSGAGSAVTDALERKYGWQRRRRGFLGNWAPGNDDSPISGHVPRAPSDTGRSWSGFGGGSSGGSSGGGGSSSWDSGSSSSSSSDSGSSGSSSGSGGGSTSW